MKFKDLLQPKDGITKGPFGGDIKKAYFVPKGENTYKVYEQGVVYDKNIDYGHYYIDEDRFIHLKRFEVLTGDILLTGAGTLGELFEVPKEHERGVINQALLRIRLNSEVVDKNYFFYYFKWYIKDIVCRLNGDSVIPNLPPIPILKDTDVDIPSIEEQRKIAKVLSVIDSKIELNNKINSELEAMAKELYEYWFVQFDFPDENGRPYKSSGGKMVWSDELKREIPEGWKSFLLRDLFDYLEGPGITKDKYSTNPTDLNFINIRCIENGFVNTDNCNRIKKDKIEGYDKFMLQVNDIIISTSGTLGTIGIITKDNLPLLLNTSIIRFRSIEKQYFCYMWQYLKSDLFVKLLNQASTGSIQKNVGPTHLNEMHILKPPKELIEKFETIIFPTFSKIVNMNNENRKLSELRDFLLPMLMNGQVTVR